ncbi:MAG TPA: Fur family transcriptional regulator [Rhodopila sp.]
MSGRLEQLCQQRGIRISEQRRAILHVLDTETGHPSAEDVHQRVAVLDSRISLATVYRMLNILSDAGLLSRVEFGDGRAHYEQAGDGHHEHLVDVETGQVVEFCDNAIESLLREAAKRLGYRLLQYKLELFAASETTADAFIDQHRASERGYRQALDAVTPSDHARTALPGSASYPSSLAPRRRSTRWRNRNGAVRA